MDAETDLDPRAIMLLSSRDPRRIAFEAQIAERLRADREIHAARLASEPQVEPRVALRTAIEQHQAAARRLADLAKALPASEAAVMQARRAIEAATEAVEKAKADAAAYATARALGTAGAAPPPLRNTRLKLADAEDALAVAKVAAADLAKQREEAQRALSWSRPDDAVAAVIRSDPATKALLERFERSRRETADLRQAVELVAGYFPHGERLALRSERVEVSPSATRTKWERALAALREDADAALPM
jgi:hypothetical protein